MPLGGVEKKKSAKKKKKISKKKRVRSNERPQRKLTPKQFVERHETHEDLFYFGQNMGYDEVGWTCGQCDTNAAFEEHPDVDRGLISWKVQCLLEDWNSSDYVDAEKEGLYISNSTEAEIIAHRVIRECEESGKYSEAFIKEATKRVIVKESVDLDVAPASEAEAESEGI